MQGTIACLQGLCGVDADKAYLQAEVQLNQAILALSNNSADYLGSTRLQDWATNSIADSRSTIGKATHWLRVKYCVAVATCTPGLSFTLNICNITRPGAAFDQTYKNQIVQYYVDEIALAQIELQNGLDCEVKAWATKVIKEDQIRIERLYRCNICI